MGASYIYNPLLGYFSELYASNDTKGFLRLLSKSMGGLALVALVCILGFAFLGDWLLITVFGESIAKYTYLLIPLVGFAIITGVQWFLNDLLISLRAFKMTFVSSVASFLVAVLLETPLINAFGPNGVTLTGIAACVTGLVIMATKLATMLANR